MRPRLKLRPLRRARAGLRRARLRTRVLAGVLAVTLAALVGFDIAAVTALRGYLIGQTDSQLQSVLNVYRLIDAILLAPSARGGSFTHLRTPAQPRQVRQGPPPNLKVAGIKAPFLQPFSFTLVSGRTAKPVSPTIVIRGLAIGSNPGLIPHLPGNLTALAASGHGVTVPARRGNQPLRLMATPIPGGGILVAATSLDGVSKTVGQLELILIIGSAVAGLLAAAGTAWLMRRGLRPVEVMAAQADKIKAGDLTGRVRPDDARTEVGRLGAALNGMLARIQGFVAEREASQQATSRFFADASHELRTPLASLRANAELYQQGALTERAQVDEAMSRIAAEARRMGGLVDDMLRLARLDQHPEHRKEKIDITALAGECVQRARTLHPERAWQARIAAGLATAGDEELVRRAIDNLLDNVAAHTPGGATATLTAARSGAAVTVEVSDDGPGVPGDQLPRIFDRFYRAGAPSARAGSGLGLAIAAAAVSAHHGTAVAALNHPHGLRVTLTFPAAPAAGSADLAADGPASLDHRTAGSDGPEAGQRAAEDGRDRQAASR